MRINGNDIYMVRGDTISITVSVFDRENNPIELKENKDIIFFTVKVSANHKNFVIQKKIIDFNDMGEAIIEISSSETSSLRYGRYVYDIQWTQRKESKEDVVRTIIPMSWFTIEHEVTFNNE